MNLRTQLVRNLLNTNHTQIQRLTVNLVAAKTRVDTLEGRSYTVVPMVLLTEGVHAGSSGPLLYNAEEMGKTPQVWNHKPVVIYHPELNGEGISACSPAIVENRSIGLIFNTKFEKNRLTAEAWVDMEKCKKVDERVHNGIVEGKMMELSTGLFCDLDAEPGEFTSNAKGTKEKYVGIARNFRADHLAVLPDKVGACSIADGAGFMRNEKKDPAWAGLKILMGKLGLSRFLSNELSFGNVSDALRTAIQARLNSGDQGPWPWVCDVYENFFIYEYDGKLFQLGYTSDETGVTLSEDQPKEVIRVTEYRTVGGAYVGNTSDQPENTSMNKTQMVDAIIANKASGWSETDRPVLMAMADAQVSNIHKGMLALNAQAATPAPAVDPKKVIVDAIIGNAGWTEQDRTTLMAMNETQLARIKGVPAAPVIPATVAQQPGTVTANVNQPLTEEAYIAQAPAAIREVLRNGAQLAREERTRLVGVITANARNQFSKEYLETVPLEQLRAFAALAAEQVTNSNTVPMFNYAGQGAVLATNENEECLEMPALDFAAKK